jgi:nicotinate-nucleotide adenylyltransferase
MKIGLYFGSFNPIHHGHLIIASYILNNCPVDQIWFVVSPQNPLKPAAGLLNEYHRLHLVQLAVEEVGNMRASDIEFKLPRPSYTIDTLTYLHEKYPTYQFSVIMGGDSFKNISHWKNHEVLLANYELYVYRRPGFELQISSKKPNIHLIEAPYLEISATQIRENIKKGKSIRFLVPERVREEIEHNGYYRS